MAEARRGAPARTGLAAALAPALALAAATTAAWLVYEHAPPAVAGWAIFPYALGLVLGPALVYPLARHRGAGVAAATAAALLTPILWIAKEVWRTGRVYPAAEALFYAANPLCLGLLVAATCQMAVAELALARARRTSAGGPLAVIAAVAALAAAAAWVGHDNGGREIFYAYVALHGWLFGPGS